MTTHSFKVNKLVSAQDVITAAEAAILGINLSVKATITNPNGVKTVTITNNNVHGHVTCVQHNDGTTDIDIVLYDMPEVAGATHPSSNFIVHPTPVLPATLQGIVNSL